MPFISTIVTTPVNIQSDGNLYLTPTGQILVNSTAPAVRMYSASLAIVDGYIVSGNASAIYDAAGDATNTVMVGTSGRVSAENTAVELNGASATLENAGAISSRGNAALSTGANFAFSNTGTVTGVLRSEGDNARITNGGAITNARDYAVYSVGNNLKLSNSGTISSAGAVAYALTAGGSSGTITNTGLVLGEGGISLGSSSSTGVQRLINEGRIVASTSVLAAVALGSSSSQTFSLLNSGEIVGQIQASSGADSITNTGLITGTVLLSTGSDLLTNYGTIAGSVSGGSTLTVVNAAGGVMSNVSTGGALTLTNNGVMGAVSSSVLSDTVTNNGVTGSINLGTDNDTYNGLFGRVNGTVTGGLGNDRLVGGAFADVMYGDNASGDTSGGLDVLFGGYGEDVLYGGYAADQLYGNQDDDVLYGNQDDDWIHGGQGGDVLYGGQGNDTLNGGVGDDVLSGGLGDDTFVFSGLGFGHEVVTDFRGGGANDIIQVSTDVYSDFAAVQARARAVSNGTLPADDAGDTILLLGIAPGALTAAMFVFG